MGELYLDGTKFASDVHLEQISFENGEVPEYITSIDCPLSASEEVSFECEVDVPKFSQLMGVDLARNGDLTGFTVECNAPHLVQIRRHRKKRINKKWAKRYGYKIVLKRVRMTDVSLTQKDADLLEFIGRLGPYYIV